MGLRANINGSGGKPKNRKTISSSKRNEYRKQAGFKSG